MAKLPDDITSHDVDQWLGGTWFKAQIDDEVRICTLVEADYGSVCVEDIDGNVHQEVPLTDIRLHWAMCGSLNVSPVFALYAGRLPRRQWRRSYSSRSLAVTVPDEWAVMRAVGADGYRQFAHRDSHAIVRAAFNPVYPDVGDAIDSLRSARVASVATSPHVILSGGTYGKAMRLHYKGKHVGTITDGELSCYGVSTKTKARILSSLGGYIS